MTRPLAGKVALVTGAGRGLGRACATIFAREGARVVAAEINPETGEDTARAIRDSGGEAISVRADVSQSADIEAMVRAAVDSFGGLDCAVNNAVLDIRRTPLAEIDEEDWDRAAAVNITGVFLCMKYEIAAMLERGGGAIVNIGSSNEHGSMPGLAWYLGAKQAVYGMTKCAARDYGDKGIRINAVGPGPMWTPALRETAEMRPGHLEAHLAHIPLRRIAEPDEVAEAAVWLCTPAASYVHGHAMMANGGYVM
ncbi:MAG: glucose 1-dehydrogenase [Sphingomonadales bacterium]|nr:glucose 1-dehydrogenase [Sphingomonadales bacterium]